MYTATATGLAAGTRYNYTVTTAEGIPKTFQFKVSPAPLATPIGPVAGSNSSGELQHDPRAVRFATWGDMGYGLWGEMPP